MITYLMVIKLIHSNHKNMLIDIHVIGFQYPPFLWCHHMISASAKYFRRKVKGLLKEDSALSTKVCQEMVLYM